MSRQPRKKKSKRRLLDFLVIENPAKRSNPQSLRRVLYDITRFYFREDLDKAATSLKTALRTRNGRTLHSTFSDEILYNLLIDKTHIKYVHLEGYARHLHIPVALILLYSRITANQDDGAPHHNKAMLRAIQRVAKAAEEKLDANQGGAHLYGIEDFVSWIETYEREAAYAESPQLFSTTEE